MAEVLALRENSRALAIYLYIMGRANLWGGIGNYDWQEKLVCVNDYFIGQRCQAIRVSDNQSEGECATIEGCGEGWGDRVNPTQGDGLPAGLRPLIGDYCIAVGVTGTTAIQRDFRAWHNALIWPGIGYWCGLFNLQGDGCCF